MKIFVLKLAFKNIAGQKTRMLFQFKKIEVFTCIFNLVEK